MKDFNFTRIIAALATTLILGFIYKRAIDREVPKPVSPLRALVPVALGIVSMIIGGYMGVLFMAPIPGTQTPVISNIIKGMSPLFGSFTMSFLIAGFPEELVKFILILLFGLFFKPKTKNLYEYVLIGAGIGLGFTIAEEFSYANSFVTYVTRAVFLPAHVVFNMIMAEFMGRAIYNKLNGKKSVVLYWILALVVPTFLHTLFDASTSFNLYFQKQQETNAFIFSAIGSATLLFAILFVLIRFRKNAAKYSAMSLLEPKQ